MLQIAIIERTIIPFVWRKRFLKGDVMSFFEISKCIFVSSPCIVYFVIH